MTQIDEQTQPNFTQVDEDHSREGYTARIRTNKLAPASGSPALTVVEFSLLPAIRDKLKMALDAYFEVHGRTMNNEALGAIMAECMPEQILRDLNDFGHSPGAKTVYLIHNLPEISDEKVHEILVDRPDKKALLAPLAYTNYIKHGIAAAADLIPKGMGSVFTILRSPGRPIIGEDLHKHPTKVDMLGGIVSNGAPTRFTDFQTLLEESAASTLPIKVTGQPSKFIPLNSFATEHPMWRQWADHIDIEIAPGHEATWEDLVARHSQEAVVDKGSLAIWANDGELFHQAVKTPAKSDSPQYDRVVIGECFERNDPAKAGVVYKHR